MKLSTLRCSFGSIQSSGLNVPSEPSPRGINPAILHGKSETSKVSTRPKPFSPAMRRRQLVSTPQPSGDTMPSPVMTTRRIKAARHAREDARASRRRRFFQEFHGVPNRDDRLGGIVGNLDAELFLESHDEFDGVEGIGAQIVDEIGIVGDLVGFDSKVLDHDFLHALGNIAHLFIPSLRFLETGPLSLARRILREQSSGTSRQLPAGW